MDSTIPASKILNDVEATIRGLADAVTQSRPTQADLEAIVTKSSVEAEAIWDDPIELAIHALIHRAWAMEIERKGWAMGDLSSDHIKALRMAQAAIRLIPKREPIV